MLVCSMRILCMLQVSDKHMPLPVNKTAVHQLSAATACIALQLPQAIPVQCSPWGRMWHHLA